MAAAGYEARMGARLRLLIVDDDDQLLRALAVLLEATEPGVELVLASSVKEALELARRRRPDVALVDLGLPDGSGLDVIAALRRASPPCTAVAFTVFDDAPTILSALRAGARGYLLKHAPTDRVLPALHDALAGGMPLSPTVANLVVEIAVGQDPRIGFGLTARETELLRLLARGSTYPECACALGISLGTVQTHVKSIYGKLDVSSKAEAAIIAARLGLVT